MAIVPTFNGGSASSLQDVYHARPLGNDAQWWYDFEFPDLETAMQCATHLARGIPQDRIRFTFPGRVTQLWGQPVTLSIQAD